jgi:hypothetical protein
MVQAGFDLIPTAATLAILDIEANLEDVLFFQTKVDLRFPE